MEDKVFSFPPMASKYVLRSTGEEVEVIDFEAKERGDRTDEDWVTYIDSDGKEHIKEHLNIQLDLKPQGNGMFEKMFNYVNSNKFPTEKNRRVFEVAKELVIRGSMVSNAVSIATQLVDEVGIEIE